MKTLQQIYDEVSKEIPSRLSDKGAGAYGPIPGGPGHTYAGFYDLLFGQYRHEPVNMLEVGVNRGGSLVMWRRFFDHPDSKVNGIDIYQSFEPFKPEDNIKAEVFDAGDDEAFQKNFGDATFDIILDDGAHEKESQIRVYNKLRKRMRPGGLYVIEDIFEVNENLPFILERVEGNIIPTVIDRRWINGQLDDVMLVFRY